MPRLLETLAFGALVAAVGIQSSLADTDSGDTKHVAVFIDKQNDDDAKVDLKVNGERYAFNLPKLAEGESRTITTDDGKSVLLNRKDDQVTAKIGNETFNLPNFDGKEHELIASFHGKPDGKVKVITKSLNAEDKALLPLGKLNGIGLDELKNAIVISGAKLSDDEQMKLKDAIKKAGINKEVKFMQRSMVISTGDADGFSWTGDGDEDQNVVIVNTDGNHSEEKHIKIERKVDKKEVEKKEIEKK